MNRKIFIIGLTVSLFNGLSYAATSTWTGAVNNDFNNAGNWDNGVPTDVAVFGTASPLSLTTTTNTVINALTFNAGALPYGITLAPSTSLELRGGPGIQNQSGVTQNFTTLFGSQLVIGNQATMNNVIVTNQDEGSTYFAGGNAGNIIINNAGLASGLYFYGNAQNASFTNLSLSSYIVLDGFADAGNATITNNLGGVTYFRGNSTADHATINNFGIGSSTITAIVSFQNNASAGNANLTNNHGEWTEFAMSASAAQSTITNNEEAITYFYNDATASSATIANTGGATIFYSSSTAAQATITNNSGISPLGFGVTGQTVFNDDSKAGNAHINNLSDGQSNFYGNSSADHSVILNASAGMSTFQNNASAGNAQITNLQGAETSFYANATAGNSTLLNNNGGQILFGSSVAGDAPTAGHATILNYTGANTQFFGNSTSEAAQVMNEGGNVLFYNNSSAGQSTIGVSSGTVQFNNAATAGNSTIQMHSSSGNGSGITPPVAGTVQFNDTSTAGSASIFISTFSVVSFSNASSASNAIIQNQSLHGPSVHVPPPGTVVVCDTNAGLSFCDNSTAANVTATNGVLGDSTLAGKMQFWGSSTAGNSTVANNDASLTAFNTSSNAGNSTIHDNGGLTNFYDVTSASNSVITNVNNGAVNFSTASTAGNATIMNNNGSANFFNVANAGNAQITNTTNSSIIQFNDASNAGNSTLTNGGAGLIQFNNNAKGGNTAIVNNGGTFSISNVTGGTSVGSLSGNGTFLLGSENLTVGGNGSDTAVSGVISGSGGSIVKVGTGTLTLTGSNTYTGGTTVGDGTLAIGSDSSLGSGGSVTLANGGTLQTGNGITTHRTVNLTNGGGILDSDGFDSTFAGTIQGTGALVKTGQGTVTVAANNTYTGGTYIDQGILRVGSSQALPSSGSIVLSNSNSTLDLNGFNQTIGSLSGSGSVLIGTGALTTGTDNTSTQYSGSLNGTGSFVKVGTGNLVLTQGDAFDGVTIVDGGNLSFTGPTNGATASVGTIGNLRNNGSVTPGINGVGVLHAKGYSGAGALNISFDQANHSSLLVDGNADITGGKLTILGTRFTSGTYSIISAGSLSGAFSEVATPVSSVFLTIKTAYTATDVQLLINSLNFVDVAQTSNQSQVAGVLDAGHYSATGHFADAINALYALPTADQARAAYTQIDGDSIASFQNSGLRTADVFTHQMMERSSPAAYGLWARGLGFSDHVDANSSIGSPKVDDTASGFQAGYDFVLVDNLLLGISGGYTNNSLTVYDRTSSGSGTFVQSGIYLTYQPSHWFVNSAMAYTTASNSSSRTIQFTGINETANGTFQTRVYTTFVEGGYHYQAGKTTSLEPTISLKNSHLHQEGFTETGAPGLNLQVNDQNTNSVMSSMGGRLMQKLWTKSAHALTLGAKAAWEHELDQTNNSITAQFSDAPAAGQFTVQGTPRSRNAAALGLDVRVPMSDSVDAFANYTATLGTGQKTQAYFGGMSLKW